MPASDPDQLTIIQGYLDRARSEYAEARAALGEALRGQAADLLPHLLAHTEELGVEQTLAVLRETPGRFGVASADGLPMAQLQALLPRLADLNWEIAGLTGEREDLAGRLTIADGRIFNVDGREATLDVATRQLRFLDHATEPLEVAVVEPHGAPALTLKKSRRRERDR